MGLPDCPVGLNCYMPPGTVPGGNLDRGYCTPMCMNPSECSAGYTGPGMPTCFGGNCVIPCTTVMGAGECPAPLTCLNTGGPANACFIAQ